MVTKANWHNLIEIQTILPTAEVVGNFTVFNIRGNNYRLIVSIDYEKGFVSIISARITSQFFRELNLTTGQ